MSVSVAKLADLYKCLRDRVKLLETDGGSPILILNPSLTTEQTSGDLNTLYPDAPSGLFIFAANIGTGMIFVKMGDETWSATAFSSI